MPYLGTTAEEIADVQTRLAGVGARREKDGRMYQRGGSVPELLVFAASGNVMLIEDAARDLEDVNEEVLTKGHWPSWRYHQVPDGLALCVRCWRVIAARQIGGERCPTVTAEIAPLRTVTGAHEQSLGHTSEPAGTIAPSRSHSLGLIPAQSVPERTRPGSGVQSSPRLPIARPS